MLLGVCFVMLVATAFPHHHHADGICMLNDVPAFCSACNGHRHGGDGTCATLRAGESCSHQTCGSHLTDDATHYGCDGNCPADECLHHGCACGCHHSQPLGCDDDCVTKFISPTPAPVHHVSPDFAFIALIYSAADLLTLELLGESSESYAPYVESLHSVALVTSGGLRAPPCA